MFSKSFQKPFILVLISIITLTSCDSLDTSEIISLPAGTCQVKVEGYINKTYIGQAVYENISTGYGTTIFFLKLEDVVEVNEDYRFVLLSGKEKPTNGKYNIINIAEFSNRDGKLNGEYSDSELEGIFRSTGGSIEIDDASNGRLKGSATYTAFSNLSFAGGETSIAKIKVTVKFDAVEGSVGIIIN